MPPATPPDLEAALDRLTALAGGQGAQAIARDAAALRDRVARGQFVVACVGQFKRGKSTLLNALLGAPVLPTGVLPLTSVPTLVRHGPVTEARVELGGRGWTSVPIADLSSYVTEAGNPGNGKGVVAAIVEIPSPLLRDGLCFVDTPGLGSVYAADAAATQALVPQIDATLLVVGADPPLTGDELALAREIAAHSSELLVVVNKADRLAEADRAEAIAFAIRTLSESLSRPIGDAYVVSAVDPHAVRWPDWERLGHALADLSRRAGRDLVAAAGPRGIQRLGCALAEMLDNEARALERPLEETAHRVARVIDLLDEGERVALDLGPLLDAEERRVSRTLEERQRAFLERSREDGMQRLRERIAAIESRFGPRRRRLALKAAVETAEDLVVPWLAEESAAAGPLYTAAVERFVRHASDHLRRIATECQGTARVDVERLEAIATDLAGRPGFRFQPLLSVTEPAVSPRDLADIILVAVGLDAPIRGHAERLLRWLLEINSSRVGFDPVERVRESRRVLEQAVVSALRGAREEAERHVAAVTVTAAHGREAVRGRLDEIGAVRAELEGLAVAADLAPQATVVPEGEP
ncbi:MAG TPA: dynamin family protein [Gemmatimonadaceae bacterium]